MLIESTAELQPKATVNESARKHFVEPNISRAIDILESTLFFQVATGGFDAVADITDG